MQVVPTVEEAAAYIEEDRVVLTSREALEAVDANVKSFPIELSNVKCFMKFIVIAKRKNK